MPIKLCLKKNNCVKFQMFNIQVKKFKLKIKIKFKTILNPI